MEYAQGKKSILKNPITGNHWLELLTLLFYFMLCVCEIAVLLNTM